MAECLDAGLPVLCEKPVSLDPAEIDALADAERRTGVPVTAGYMKRHDPVVGLFLDHCREHLAAARRLTVDIHDPNAPHQVAHLMPYDPPPFGPQPPPAREALLRALGPDATDAQREAYARGLGGSLIHQVNLVHAALAGSGRELYGRLLHSDGWAAGAGVGCRWRPDDGLVVDLTHQRLPAHRRYREVLELTAEDSTATLVLPSPYARDESATLRIDTWDAATGLATRRTRTAEPGHTGFRRQLAAWARSLGANDGTGRPPPPIRCRAWRTSGGTRAWCGRRRCGWCEGLGRTRLRGRVTHSGPEPAPVRRRSRTGPAEDRCVRGPRRGSRQARSPFNWR